MAQQTSRQPTPSLPSPLKLVLKTTQESHTAWNGLTVFSLGDWVSRGYERILLADDGTVLFNVNPYDHPAYFVAHAPNYDDAKLVASTGSKIDGINLSNFDPPVLSQGGHHFAFCAGSDFFLDGKRILWNGYDLKNGYNFDGYGGPNCRLSFDDSERYVLAAFGRNNKDIHDTARVLFTIVGGNPTTQPFPVTTPPHINRELGTFFLRTDQGRYLPSKAPYYAINAQGQVFTSDLVLMNLSEAIAETPDGPAGQRAREQHVLSVPFESLLGIKRRPQQKLSSIITPIGPVAINNQGEVAFFVQFASPSAHDPTPGPSSVAR